MSLTVLMYHELVVPNSVEALSRKINSSYVVREETFRQHMQAIHDAGAVVVDPNQVHAWLKDGSDFPELAVMITFDDGFRGNYELAYPILKSFGLAATFYVVTNRIGDDLMLSWEQLREMQAGGMTIASHTVSHPLLSTLDCDETQMELARSAEVLEKRLDIPARHLSLPNGDTNEWYRQIALDLGYKTVCGSHFGRNDSKSDHLWLDRIAVKNNTSALDVTAYIKGHWRVIAINRFKSAIKKLLVAVLSKKRYDAIYNRIAGVDEQRKGNAL